jgi:hypothetical protein
VAGKGGFRSDRELVKALSHPIRVEILAALQGRIASSNELSREMNRSLGVIAYHAKTLVKCGCVELVHTKPHPAVIEHYLSLAPRSPIPREHRRMSPSDEPGIKSAAVEVDEIGWQEIASILDTASRLVEDACKRSGRRLNGAKGISIVVGLAAFEAEERRSPDEQ